MKTKLRNTWFSKLMALCLAVVMMLSMGITSFAAIDTDSANITVSGLTSDNGAEVNAYKLIDVNFETTTQQLQEPVFVWEDSIAEWVRTNYAAYIGTNDNSVQSAYMSLDAEDLKGFLTALSEAGILGVADFTGTVENQSAEFSGVTMGQYLILAEKTGNTYNPLVANVYPTELNGEWTLSDVEVSLKGSTPGITKEIDENEDGSYAIGDIVPYEIKADIPSYPDNATNKVFTIGDLLSSGLTLNPASITVKVGDTVLTAAEYTLDTTATAEHTFLITFNYDALVAKAGIATQVTVTYNATVNDKAFTGADALGNKAFLGFTRDPFSDVDNDITEVEEDVYTYGFMVQKREAADHREIVDASFNLYDKQDADRQALGFVKVSDGVYRPFITGTDQGDPVTELETANGNLTIQGVDLGTYYLKETKTEAGYVLPKDDFTITLADGEPNGKLDTNGTSITGTTINENATAETIAATNNQTPDTATFNVYNVSSSEEGGFQLPKTGGMGTMLFTIAGIILMGGAVALIVTASRRKRG